MPLDCTPVARAASTPFDAGIRGPVEPDELPEPLDLTEPPDVWALHPWVADAANAARAGMSALIIWHFQLGG